MKSIFRISLLLAVIALAFGVRPVSAQDPTCLPGLGAEDCQLMASAHSGKYTAFVIDSFSIEASSSGNALVGDFEINISGSGGADWSKAEIVAGQPLSVLPKVAALIKLDAKIKVGSSMDVSGDLEGRIVDGFFYWKSSVPEAEGGTGDQWKKANVDAAVTAQGPGLTDTINQQGGGIFSPLGASVVHALYKIPGMFTAVGSDGEAIDGQAMRQIATSINLGSFITGIRDRQLSADLRKIIPADFMLQVVDADVNFLAFFESSMKTAQINYTQYIGKEDKLWHGFDFNANFELLGDAASILSANPGTKYTLKLSLRLSKVNEAFTTEAIADAQEVQPGPGRPIVATAEATQAP